MMSKTKKKEIFSSCCAIGDGVEEVHVLESECPINRELGKREVKVFSENEENRMECTCKFVSSRFALIPRCEHYKGIKEVQRNKQKVWKVFCGALDEQE